MGVVHSTHPRQKPASALNPWTINTWDQDGQDEEGQGAPLVQGGEGQGAQEVLRAHRKASRSSKEGSWRGKTQVRAHWITKGQEARTEECPQRIKSLRIHPCLP